MPLNSASTIQVGVSVVLADQFTQNSGRVTNAFRNMMYSLNSAASAVRQTYGQVFDVSLRAAGSIVDVYKSYASVQKDIFLTGKMADATEEQMKQLRTLAEETNLQVPLTTGDIASAEKFLAMAGNSVEKIQQFIPAVSKLSSLFSMEAGGKGGVADLITNIMTMYRMEASQVDQVANDLFVATTSSNVSLRDLAESIKYAGSEMSIMGYDVRQTAAAIGLLGDMGIQGSMAGTALANTMRYLRQSISGQKQSGYNALQQLGLTKEDFVDASGHMKDLYNVYKTIIGAIHDRGITDFEAASLITSITGVRGARNLMSVYKQMSEGSDTYRKIFERYTSREGALNQAMEEYQQSPQGQLDKLRSTLDAIKQSLGSMASEFLTPALSVLNSILKGFYELTKIPIIGTILKGGMMTLIVAPLVLGIRMMVQLVKTLQQSVLMAQAMLGKNGLTPTQMLKNAEANATIIGNAPAMMAKHGGKWELNGLYFQGYRGGKPVLYYPDAGTKSGYRSTNVPSKQAEILNSQNTKGYGKFGGTTPGQTNTFGNWFGSKAGTMGKAMGGLARVGGGVLSFLGGPWMLAIGGILTVAPMLINAIKGNTEAQEEQLRRAKEERERIQDMSAEEYSAYRDKKTIEALSKLSKSAIGRVTVSINNEKTDLESGDYLTVRDMDNLLGAMEKGYSSTTAAQ